MTKTDRPPKWVSVKFLADYFEVHPATIWRWVKIGRLPEPEQVGPNTTRWDFEPIQAGKPQQFELPGV